MPQVLITGAARGLGRALSIEAHRRGCGLWLTVRSETDKAALLTELPGANVLIADLTEMDVSDRMAKWLSEVAIDVLICNAGTGSKGPTVDTATAEQIERVLQTNCLGTFATVKGALPALRRSTQASIVTISSRRGSMAMQAEGAAKGSGCSYSYRISKAALNMLTLCLADDLEEEGITVAAIHPGRLLTKMASSDASMTPETAAERIWHQIQTGQLVHRSLWSTEKGLLPW
ncbi:SDR family oxidoreductase [Reinekea blandensis]|uniref:Short chain dehydrogenase n=1 Tax=Reinekea blandensis MED297 TaxID=314283 RepID=A4B9W3_9GAMM|nr:SDR family oxidoreductase [Reinekea blandensis]EAR11414.1 short chain dehydrogenase [Reinekea sp. MED297] [Reinekea blandensis MED297]